MSALWLVEGDDILEEGSVEIEKEDLDSLKNDGSDFIVDCWAEWCGACKQAEPIFESLATEYSDRLFFGNLNVSEDRETALEYQVSSIPTFLFFKDGELVDRVVGAISSEKLECKIEEIFE